MARTRAAESPGTYVLPLKKTIQHAEVLDAGEATFTLRVQDRADSPAPASRSRHAVRSGTGRCRQRPLLSLLSVTGLPVTVSDDGSRRYLALVVPDD